MPKHLLPSTPLNTVNTEFFAPNDATPSPTGMSKVAQAFNYVSCVQKKLILVRTQNFLSAVGRAIDVVWPFYFRTGENTVAVVARVGMAPGITGSSTGGDVAFRVRAFSAGDSSDASVGLVTHDITTTIASGALKPSDIVRRTFKISGLSPNTEYHGAFSVLNGARLVYATIHESWTVMADDSVTGVCNPDKFHVEGPIYDEHAHDLTEANNELWQHNKAPYIGWAADYGTADSLSTTSASLVDLIANSAGFYIDATYHTTRNRTTVPVKLGVRAYTNGTPTSADFRLTDGTNNIDITGAVLSTATNAKWFTTTATIPASTGTWRIQARRISGASTVFVDAVSLFPYEA